MANIVKKILLINFFCFFLFIIDRASKWLALHILPREGVFIIPKITGFILERNQGIAYSIPLSGLVLTIVVLLILALLILFLARSYKKREWPIIFGLTLIIVGAFSNFLDRLRFDCVIDMIVLTSWPVFNLADVMITVGVILILWKMVRKKKSRSLVANNH